MDLQWVSGQWLCNWELMLQPRFRKYKSDRNRRKQENHDLVLVGCERTGQWPESNGEAKREWLDLLCNGNNRYDHRDNHRVGEDRRAPTLSEWCTDGHVHL